MEIYKTEYTSIYKYDNYKYAIKNNSKINTKGKIALFQSIFYSNFLENVKHNDDFTAVFFLSDSVLSFNDFLEHCNKKYGVKKLHYTDCLNIIESLRNQIMYLERMNFSFYNLCIQKIIVIDYEHFLYIVDSNILEIKETNNKIKNIIFLKPFRKLGFISPEVNCIQSLPSHVDYRAVYYILALFIYYSLFGEEWNPNITDKNLETIYYTKLYWFLLRNLNNEPNKRNIYYI
jgi:hypothetical protein